jgi:pimeloyl-ACP methyl ester carboxylesterase
MTARELKATWIATRIAGRFSTRLSGAFASRLWFTPWPVPVSERARAKHERWLKDARPTTFRVGGRALTGYVAGDGPTVLLVHGWGETAATMGGFVEPLVRAGFRVVGVDLPGHGAGYGGRTDIFELARTVRTIAERAGGLHGVIAHSMGGYVTTVALSEGLQLDRVVLIAPASDVDHVMTKFEKLFALPPRAVAGLRADIRRRFGSGVWERLNVRKHARRFTTPVLIVHDRDDDQIDVSESEALAAVWPSARTFFTTGLGHDRPTRDPDVIGAATSFLMETTPVERRELVSA